MKTKISYFGKHFGEEPAITGEKGSGTIFFSGCNLHCQFCQNYQISQEWLGKDYSAEELADIMLDLELEVGENLYFVSPAIWIDIIKEAIILARQKGLSLPIVYNTNAYERKGDLEKLRGLIDIYLPDFKYSDNLLAEKYSKVKYYQEVAKENILEMLSQQPENIFEGDLLKKGVVIRHLILPNNIKNTLEALKIIRGFGDKVILSLMTQYEPLYKAKNFPEINRNINQEEYQEVFEAMLSLGFEEGWVQPIELNASKELIPDFNLDQPFN